MYVCSVCVHSWMCACEQVRQNGERVYLCEQVLFVCFYNNPAPVNGSMQFHYCTVSNPGTGADNAFVLKRGV